MEIYNTKADIQKALEKLKQKGEKIAFVPTMGALHEGHLTLLKLGKEKADKVVCSIFVNPTQFNDKEDLKKYPRPLEADLKKLEDISCDFVFLPEVEEMYEENELWNFDLGELDQIWEGAMRPGHFNGVTQVVYKLFTIIRPDLAIFGQKDFQQCAVIAHMIKKLQMPVKLLIHPIVREKDGLAMSSRNVRLSEEGRKNALIIPETLFFMEDLFKNSNLDLQDIKQKGMKMLQDSENAKIEYLAICETESLEERLEVADNEKYVILVVAWVDGVRLIDNLLLN